MQLNPSVADRIQDTAIGREMIALLRLILASSALVTVFLDPTQPDRYVLPTYMALILYACYSLALYILALRWNGSRQALESWEPWIDVTWYLSFIALSSGTNSIFFYFLFFAILVASFRSGFQAGLWVTIVSAGFFIVIGYLTALSGSAFELNRFLLRPIYLLVLGYMIAFWGGFEIMLKRRLALLNDINTLANPRFGVDRTIALVMEQLRAFYGAELCLLVTPEASSNGFLMRRADKHNPEAATVGQPLTAEIAQGIFALPEYQALLYSKRSYSLRSKIIKAYNIEADEYSTGNAVVGDVATADAVAVLLDTDHFVSLPIRCHGSIIGRLCLTSSKAFDISDIGFIFQVMEQVTPIIENIRLVDALASNAAETERQRIARDIHDSVIQPYIGLQMGLVGVREKASHEPAGVVEDLDFLIGLTEESVTGLRNYIYQLKSASGQDSSLIPAVHRFTEKFKDVTGIAVEVQATPNIHVPDRLAAEVFQIVSEGLSNIRRHTQARQAKIGLERQNGHLIVRIENKLTPLRPKTTRPGLAPPKVAREGSAAMPTACIPTTNKLVGNELTDTPVSSDNRGTLKTNGHITPFTPGSISERAEALGGNVTVEQDTDKTAVVVTIPL